MSAVLFRTRAEFRARLPSMLALALLAGFASGAVMTTAAGARRTDSSYRRFAVTYKAADMLIYPAFGPQFASADFNKVEKLPEVSAAARAHILGSNDPAIQAVAGDARYGRDINRARMLEGRWPRSGSLDEAAIAYTFARARHLHLGSPVRMEFAPSFNAPVVAVTVHVVGIEASPGEFPPQVSTFGISLPSIHVTHALYQSLKDRAFTLEYLVLRFKHGAADVPKVTEELNRAANGKPQLSVLLGDQATNVERSIHLQAVALWIVGGLVALIGVLVLSQLIARQAVIDSNDGPALLAVGMTRKQIWLSGMWRSAVIGMAAAATGVIIAVAASPLMPIGTARVAESHPGVSFDALVLVLGALATVMAVLSLAARPVWRTAWAMQRDLTTGTAKPSLAARAAARPGFPPSVATGMRLALEPGRGRTEVPVRSSLLSVALSIAALAAALTFGAGMNHLLATPLLYGWNWDIHVSDNTQVVNTAPALKVLQADPSVEDISLVDSPPLALGKSRFDSIVLQSVKGSIAPVLIAGKIPSGPGEVALGARTLRDAHARIGSTVSLSITAITGPAVDMRVVGTVVIPPNSDSARLGGGAVLAIEAEKSMIPPEVHAPPFSDIYARFVPGTDKRAAVARLERSLGSDFGVILPARPTDLVNFGQVQNLPILLAGLVAVLGAATLAHTLITSIRRRRRDLAILKMIGFVPSQVRAAVAWQASTMVSLALLIGLPTGIVLGRVVWTIFANQIGTLPEPITPSLPLLLTIPCAIVLANLIAAVPAVIASRMKPALALRAE